MLGAGFHTVQVKRKTFDRYDALEGGVGGVDTTGLPVSVVVFDEFHVARRLVAIAEIEAFEGEVKGGREVDVGEIAREADGGEADILLLEFFVNPSVKVIGRRSLPSDFFGGIRDPESEEGEGQHGWFVLWVGIDQVRSIGRGQVLEEVDDLQGVATLGIGPEERGVGDGSADDGFAVSAEPISGSDTSEQPVCWERLEVREDFVPMAGVVEIAEKHAFDGVVCCKGGSRWTCVHGERYPIGDSFQLAGM